MSAGLTFADKGNGSVLLSWLPFTGINPASYNVYVNGVLNQNVAAPARSATVAGLTTASYNAGAVAAAGDGSHRPESLPPVGKITDAVTVNIRVAAVVGGNEVAEVDGNVTPQPTSVMLTTPMPRGRFAFPNTPGGY